MPVIEVIILSFNAGFELVANARGEVKSGFTYTDTIRLGATYKGNEWTPIFTKNPKFTKHDTVWTVKGGAYVKVYVRPELSIMLYNVAGPYMDVVPYLDFTGTVGGDYDWYWEMCGGIDSNLGFDVSVLGSGIMNYSTKLIEWKIPEPITTGFQEKSGTSGETNEIKGITFVTIPGGTFQMGDEIGDLWYRFSLPVHAVTVSSFEMGVYEVTNSQYAAYLNASLRSGDITMIWEVLVATGEYNGREYISLEHESPSSFHPYNFSFIMYNNGTFSVKSGYENWPVKWVTWYGAKSFALYYGLDLPTEAEWEYACRGGKQYKYGTVDGTISTNIVNYWGTGIKHPIDVGSYPANPFGLYDMSGNVREWCHDWYGSYTSGSALNPSGVQIGRLRVIRGGSWDNAANSCRSADRDFDFPGERFDSLGFRVVRRSSPQNY